MTLFIFLRSCENLVCQSFNMGLMWIFFFFFFCCIQRKFYLWTLKFKFCVIFTYHWNSLCTFFSQPFKDVKTPLSSWVVQKEIGWIWSLPISGPIYSYLSGLPWRSSGWESALQGRGHGFHPWSDNKKNTTLGFKE